MPTTHSGHRLDLTLGGFNILSSLAIGLVIFVIATGITPLFPTIKITRTMSLWLIILLYALYILVGLRFMFWLRAYLKVERELHGDTNDISPRLAFLGFATPWLNLFLPFRIMLRLLHEPNKGDIPEINQTMRRVAIAWWTFHISYLCIAPISLVLVYYQSELNFYEGHRAGLLALNGIAVIVVSLCAHSLVKYLAGGRILHQT